MLQNRSKPPPRAEWPRLPGGGGRVIIIIARYVMRVSKVIPFLENICEFCVPYSGAVWRLNQLKRLVIKAVYACTCVI